MTSQQQTFINLIRTAAEASEAQYGVPAAVTVAQAILETGWGKSVPPGSNNYFGIKAVPGQPFVTAGTFEYVAGSAEPQPGDFAAYPSLQAGFAAHARLLADDPRYAPAMAVRNDLAAFCTALMNCGYSTNRPGLAPGPKYYADILMELIQEFSL